VGKRCDGKRKKQIRGDLIVERKKSLQGGLGGLKGKNSTKSSQRAAEERDGSASVQALGGGSRQTPLSRHNERERTKEREKEGQMTNRGKKTGDGCFDKNNGTEKEGQMASFRDWFLVMVASAKEGG